MSGGPVSEVEQLLLNAQLWDAIEPYRDDSLSLLGRASLSTPQENDFLASMLAWERAPVVPICQWFSPELVLPPPASLADEPLKALLAETLQQLARRGVALETTEHLSDRQLYCLLVRDILPSPEKMLPPGSGTLLWRCLDEEADPETWLRYYATADDRDRWEAETGQTAPPKAPLPYPRRLPRG